MSRLDEMLGFLPEFLRDFRELREIIVAEEPEFDMLVEYLGSALNSMFIETADEMGLKKYEKLLSITPASTDIEERRANVMALWFSNMPFTVRALKERLSMIQGNTNVDAWVTNYLLHIKTELSTKEQISNARIIIDSMIPANLGLQFDYETVVQNVIAWYGVAALYSTSTTLNVDSADVSELTWLADESEDALMDESGIILFE